MLMLAIVVGIDTQVTQASLAVVSVDTAGIGQSDRLPTADHYYPQELPIDPAIKKIYLNLRIPAFSAMKNRTV